MKSTCDTNMGSQVWIPAATSKAECGATMYNVSASSEEAVAQGPAYGLLTDQSVSSKFNGMNILSQKKKGVTAKATLQLRIFTDGE